MLEPAASSLYKPSIADFGERVVVSYGFEERKIVRALKYKVYYHERLCVGTDASSKLKLSFVGVCRPFFYPEID